jgi:phosphohistidine phosphatase
MRRLMLARHAEAGSAAAGQSDRDRPLTSSGAATARALGAELARLRLAPDLVLCSSARRTRETAEMLLDGASIDCAPVCLDALYSADVGSVLRIVSENACDDLVRVLVVGHNPTIEALANILAAPKRDGTVAPGHIGGFAPATRAIFGMARTTSSWRHLRPPSIALERLLRPADYGK